MSREQLRDLVALVTSGILWIEKVLGGWFGKWAVIIEMPGYREQSW